MGTVLDIYDPELYVDGPIHEMFAELRGIQPVYWQDMPGEPGYWAILKHADVAHVARNPLLFSAEREGVILENQPPERLEQTRNMLLMMDPPRHTEYRRPLAEHFKARVIGEMEDRVRALTRQLLENIDGDVEFVHEIAGVLPSQVVGGLFGIPAADWTDIRQWAEQSTSQQDPELVGDFDVTAEMTKMAIYAIQFAMARRAGSRGPISPLSSSPVSSAERPCPT